MSRAGELPSRTQGAFAVEKTRLAGQETHFLPDCDCVKGNRALEANKAQPPLAGERPKTMEPLQAKKTKKVLKNPSQALFHGVLRYKAKLDRLQSSSAAPQMPGFRLLHPTVPAGIRLEARHFYRAPRANLYSAALPKVLQRKQVSFPSPSHTPMRRRGSYNPCEIINMAQQKRECGEQ